MSNTIEVRVPDIGGFADVPVIDVLVKPGDRIKKDDALVTLESDKASMDIPSSAAGVVKEIRVKSGDKVSQGSVIVALESDEAPPTPATASAAVIELVVPDLGDFGAVPVIDVLVKPGDRIEKESALVTLESDKASMDVPASAAGVVKEVRVKIGDNVSKGTVIATLETAAPAIQTTPAASAPAPAPAAPVAQDDRAKPVTASLSNGASAGIVHASPAIRRFARELGVDLRGVTGSGPHGRVTREDVQGFVKRALAGGGGSAPSAGFNGLPAWPKLDFAQYGAIERKPLPRIKRISGPNLHRNWLQIPHITNYERADVTELEAFRLEVNAEQSKSGGAKLTMLAFLIKACVAALERFPEFNSSLDGDELIYKQYYNIGFAADTPGGLVVPVLKNAGTLGLLDIARESAELAGKARDGKLGMADMQGGTFTISSIGGIGGTQFTQIVNAPEVAILGATRATVEPVWDGKAFVPRTILPISVSYDHRVIDGAGAARFLVYLASLLRDFRRVLL
jgi:pyruvate dehydrogenase E2 component (dihydrolipoamide acetyltransferase)